MNRLARHSRALGGGRTTGRIRPVILIGVIGVIGLLTGALAACSDDTTAASRPDGNTLAWHTCDQDDRAQCATLTVPIDPSTSGGPTLDLALIRYPASAPSQRIGTLLVNPGGPGASGKQFLLGQPFTAPITQRFDLVSWDPRGVGESSPLHCGTGVTRFLADDPSPDDAGEQTRIDDDARSIAEDCGTNDPTLVGHLGTRESVEDMDAIRVALGEDTISYIGFSYGTLYGLGYATAHPQHLRALVLDGVVDPTQDLSTFLLGQTAAFQAALERALEACATQASCPLGSDPMARTLELAAKVEAAPLPDGAGVELADGSTKPVGPAELSAGIVESLYDQADRPDLWAAIADGLAGKGDALGRLADAYYDDGAFTAYAATTCVDVPHPVGSDAYRSLADQAATVSPLLGPGIANEMLPCAFWPAPVTGILGAVTAPDAPPSLVIGRTGDPATPYDNSVAVASTLHSAHLVTSRGDGHTSYNDSSCVHDVVDRYLLSLDVPGADPNCD